MTPATATGDGPPSILVLGLIGPGPHDPLDPHVLVHCWPPPCDHLPDDPLLVVSPLPSSGSPGRDRQLRRIVLANHGATDVVEAPSLDPATAGAGPGDAVSPAELRQALAAGRALPGTFTYPEVDGRAAPALPARSTSGA